MPTTQECLTTRLCLQITIIIRIKPLRVSLNTNYTGRQSRFLYLRGHRLGIAGREHIHIAVVCRPNGLVVLRTVTSAAGRDGKISIDAIPQGGGSEAFSKFLTEELRPAIDSAYRTNGWNMLIGHSYAGLFTLNTFLRHTELFDTYLAVDPSLWWDQGRLVREAEALVAGRDFKGKSLYIGVASKKRTDRVDIHLDKVSYLLSEVLPQAENLRFFSKSFPDENHGTVAVPGIYDGIKQLFGK